jgi:hypothetical protein
VARRQWGRAESVRQHAEQHGEPDHGQGDLCACPQLLEGEEGEDQRSEPARPEPADEQDRVTAENRADRGNCDETTP